MTYESYKKILCTFKTNQTAIQNTELNNSGVISFLINIKGYKTSQKRQNLSKILTLGQCSFSL